ncbi:nuclear transport factor 2 family protein [Pedobacter aquatilis]|uniref:nuclear transport factor 2 family protein n=1 Tax=Pedobacter aquatilis TaxID=351343 RepID=UPI00292F294A|nr:nuclear transport factor 2 family protein [Pedobacter aquatilis]
MKSQYLSIIKTAYQAFNARDIDSVFKLMHNNVHWPKAFEGGYVIGLDAVREYWTSQWKEINPRVDPTSIVERPDEKYEILVHQLVKDLDGNVIFDGMTKHIYSFKNHLIYRMDIEDI